MPVPTPEAIWFPHVMEMMTKPTILSPTGAPSAPVVIPSGFSEVGDPSTLVVDTVVGAPVVLTAKKATMVSMDVMRSSQDHLRNLLGLYWTKLEDKTTGEYELDYSTSILFSKFDIDVIEDLNLRHVSRMEAYSPYIDHIEFNPDFMQTVNIESLLPNYKIPLRVYGSIENNRGDRFWNILFAGGKFGEETYPSIVDSPYVYYDEVLKMAIPYSVMEIKEAAEDLEGAPSMSVSYRYNSYNTNVKNYQRWTSELESELLIPNGNILSALVIHMMTLSSYINGPEVWNQFGENYLNYVTYAFEDLIRRSINSSNSGGEPIEPDEIYEWARKVFDPASTFSAVIGGTTTEEMIPDRGNFWALVISDAIMPLVYDGTEVYDDDGDGVTDHLREKFEAYLGDLENFISKIPESIKQGAIPPQRNIIFDETSTSDTGTGYTRSYIIESGFPYYMRIEFPRHNSSKYGGGSTPTPYWAQVGETTGFTDSDKWPVNASLQDHAAGGALLQALKDVKNGEYTNLQMTPRSFMCEKKSVDNSDSEKTYKYETEIKNYNTIDLVELLTHMYNRKPTVEDAKDYMFAGVATVNYAGAWDNSGLHRYVDRQSIANVMDDISSMCEDYFGSWFKLTDPDASDDTNKYLLKYVLQPKPKHSEVLAYRVEKIGGVSVGDQATAEPIQDFWIFNNADKPNAGVEETIKLHDTQVKYGQDYTYNIYAYVMVLGHKYRFGDARLTQTIATVDTDGDGFVDRYCLQFYDPLSNEYAEQLFYQPLPSGPFDLGTITSTNDWDTYTRHQMAMFAEEWSRTGTGGSFLGQYQDEVPDRSLYASELEWTSLSLRNEFATEQQGLSEHPHIADFNYYIEPCFTLIEVPLYSKSLKILDNPSNAADVNPFQFLDASQRIGFDVKYQSYDPMLYPLPASGLDINIMNDYLHGRDLTEDEEILKPSLSPPRFIEVYRTDRKPTSLLDFEGKMIQTIDLKIKDSDQSYSDAIISNKILTNKKYYYILRFLNENKVPGHFSQIIEAELIDDGGYIYSSFDVLSEEEYSRDAYTKPSINFKKLFQIQPNLSQLELNVSNANLELPATKELNNVQVGTASEGIWGETFKIRLTSKKTGKKIDLNVTFKIQEEDRYSSKL